MSTTEHKVLAVMLANKFDHPIPPEWDEMKQAAAELRRLSAFEAEATARLASNSDAMDKAASQIKNLKNQIHTCGPNCMKAGCVNERLWSAHNALQNVLSVIQRYLPPDGISVDQAINEIISLVDPWPGEKIPPAQKDSTE